MRRRLVFVVPAVAAALVALPSGGLAAREDPPPDRTCTTRVEGRADDAAPPYRRSDVGFGRLYFLGLDRFHRWLPARNGDGTLKIPAMVRDGPPVTVRITPAGGSRARLDFDREEWRRTGRRILAGDGQLAVRFIACPANTRRFSDGKPLGPWTAYNGGFLVARPGCVVLTASGAGMRTVRRRAALGVPVARCR